MARARKAATSEVDEGDQDAEHDLVLEEPAPGESVLDGRAPGSVFDHAGSLIHVTRLRVNGRSVPATDTGGAGEVVDGPSVDHEIRRRWGGGLYRLDGHRGSKATSITREIAGRSLPLLPFEEDDEDEDEPPVWARALFSQVAQLRQGAPGLIPGAPAPVGLAGALHHQQLAAAQGTVEQARELKDKNERLQQRVEDLQAALAKAEAKAERAQDALARAEAEQKRALEDLRKEGRLEAQLAEMRARLDSKPQTQGADSQADLIKALLLSQKEETRSQKDLMISLMTRDPLAQVASLVQLVQGKEKDSIGQIKDLMVVMQTLREAADGPEESEFTQAAKAAAQVLGPVLAQQQQMVPQVQAPPPPQAPTPAHNPPPPPPRPQVPEDPQAEVTRWAEALAELLRLRNAGVEPEKACSDLVAWAARWGKRKQAELALAFASTTADQLRGELVPQLLASAALIGPQPAVDKLNEVVPQLLAPDGAGWLATLVHHFRQAASQAKSQALAQQRRREA